MTVSAELHEVIAKLREDLSTAMADSEGKRLLFEVGPIDVTLSVTVTSEGGGKAGVRFWVVDAGIDGKLGKATGQQIKLTLTPKDTQRPTANVSYGAPYVTGDATPNES